MKIGFVGTGVMGSAMVNNLLKAGFSVIVYNRTKEHAKEVIANGAKWAESPMLVAKDAEIIISIVGFPKDVEEIYFGKEGFFSGAHNDLLAIDMTTSSPKLAQRISMHAKKLNMSSLDAPVSGGDIGAKSGSLTIMVGGSQQDLLRAKPVLNKLGSSIHLFGGAGRGQMAKLANQIMIAGTMTGMVESLVYAKKYGLDQTEMIKVIDGGSAANWSMKNYAPRILEDDFKPGFAAKHFLKDLRLALDSASEIGLDLPATKKAEELYQKMIEADLGDLGTQGLIKVY